MRLKEFKQHIESFPDNTVFPHGISSPFSWRGSYSEVAFSLLPEPSTKEEVLDKIQEAYDGVFIGYKGGEYTYDDYTDIHFEERQSDYTDGDYAREWIEKITNTPQYNTIEEQLVKTAFK